AECIKTRMELVREYILLVIKTKGIERPARILSLGSGPAREIELSVAGPGGLGGSAEFTLVDQETAALNHAIEKIHPHVMQMSGAARIRCMNVSFTDILRGAEDFHSLPPQDMIYSLGLIDYLTDHRAAALVRRLYQVLAPGGLLVIGNMN